MREAYKKHYALYGNETTFRAFELGYREGAEAQKAALAGFQWVDAIKNKPNNSRGVFIALRSKHDPGYKAVTQAYFSGGDWCGIDYHYQGRGLYVSHFMDYPPAPEL